MITGGLGTAGSDPTEMGYTGEEIRALVDEAHRLGRKVAAHIYGGPGAREAIVAGLDSLEHGAYLTGEDLDLMADRGTTLVATYGVMQLGAEAEGLPAFMREKLKGALDVYLDTLQRARKAGVVVATGGDVIHGRPDLEVTALVRAGFTTPSALRAATINGARLCGLGDVIGTVEPGKVADLVALHGNPLDDIRNIASVKSVMKQGDIQGL